MPQMLYTVTEWQSSRQEPEPQFIKSGLMYPRFWCLSKSRLVDHSDVDDTIVIVGNFA